MADTMVISCKSLKTTQPHLWVIRHVARTRPAQPHPNHTWASYASRPSLIRKKKVPHRRKEQAGDQGLREPELRKLGDLWVILGRLGARLCENLIQPLDLVRVRIQESMALCLLAVDEVAVHSDLEVPRVPRILHLRNSNVPTGEFPKDQGFRRPSPRPVPSSPAVLNLDANHHVAPADFPVLCVDTLSLIHISEPTRLLSISYAVFCLKKKKKKKTTNG
eukprot:TRINITY_DN19769_c0_g1_i1.p1 TRINITY_DN19769_c0_g1~~TRINITY_DN19769_c0_g1_i1.p1  ORF type:complete len:220 (-),score=24.38 TRINITY_DN19769_c0_g1_i1:108-767(-)